MIVGDLFSGIGGFSLAAHWMGWRTAWFSEVDPYACRVLAHHWPDVPNLGDIRAVDWTTVQPVDVVTAGFPCQPHSVAGKRLASADERDLFDEVIRCLRVVRPHVATLENVPGLLTSESGRFFGRVLGQLAKIGYDAEWQVLSAKDVGADHERKRVWIVAYPECAGRQGLVTNDRISCGARAAHAKPLHRAAFTRRTMVGNRRLVRDSDGLSVAMERRRLHALGNTIVPQCALEIFRRVEMIAQHNGLPMQEAA